MEPQKYLLNKKDNIYEIFKVGAMTYFQEVKG